MTDVESLVAKAATLQEALPYIRDFHGAVLVVKYGGHAMIDPELQSSFARDMVLLKYVGLHPVVVHGGGPQIDATLDELGVKSERVDGLRITDAATMRVVEMVLGGQINAQIVALIGRHGGRAVGITGRDDNFLRAEPQGEVDGVDLGRVGRITDVNPSVVRQLIDGGFIPVVAPVAVDHAGDALNVNADTAAGRIAEALGARKLVLMTDVEGVKNAAGEVVSSLTLEEARELHADGILVGGMIPKVRCALDALNGGVRKTHIIDGRVRHAVLLEIFTDQGIGTQILASPANRERGQTA